MSGSERAGKLGVLRTLLLGFGFVLLAGSAMAADSGMRAELACRPEAAPGRVLCELKFSAQPGVRLVWADALVTSAPEFVRPLRARIAPERFKGAGSLERKLSLGFVATQVGVGRVIVKARAVVCRGEGEEERCRPESQDVSAEVRVGG